MSFYQLESIDQAAEKYLKVLGLLKQADSKDCRCTLLLCVASRLFPAHQDSLRSSIEQRSSPIRAHDGFEKVRDAFKKVHDAWNGPFDAKSTLWGRAAASITWRAGIDGSALAGASWADNLHAWSNEGPDALKKWSEVAHHLRNALAHGGVRWVRDARHPSQRAEADPDHRLRLQEREEQADIGGVVLISEVERGSGIFRACFMSVETLETLMFKWLRFIKDSGLRTSISEFHRELFRSQRAA